MSNLNTPYLHCLVVAIGVVIVDQLSKYEAAQYGLESLNTGISFGLLGDQSQFVSSAILVSFAVLGILAIKHYTKFHPKLIGLFIGGALSNILDRFLFGGVRDWLPVPILQMKNNVADWAIFVAVILLLYYEWSRKEPSLR